MDEENYCGICRYFVRNGPGNPVGYCARNPPQAFVIAMQQPKLAGQMPMPVFQSAWPPIEDTKFCGEFRPAERKPLADPRSIDLSKLDVEETEGKA